MGYFNTYGQFVSNSSYLSHHGIRGQKWGKKNGPPYPLGGGDYSAEETRKIYRERLLNKNSIYNKKHFDKVIKIGTALSTLSYDKNRTKGADMFYATYQKADKHQYGALFNKKIEQPVYDEKGNQIGTGSFFKFKINNNAKSDIKVASEDSGANAFKKLYKKDRDFYNFVTDSSRMENHFVKNKYVFKGYREAKAVLDKLKNPSYVPSEKDVQKIYRMFNYVLPSDGGGNSRAARDVQVQRTKFFNELSKSGYGAVLDTNDAIYGGFKANAPVIVFDMKQVVPSDIRRTNIRDKRISTLAYLGKKITRL